QVGTRTKAWRLLTRTRTSHQLTQAVNDVIRRTRTLGWTFPRADFPTSEVHRAAKAGTGGVVNGTVARFGLSAHVVIVKLSSRSPELQGKSHVFKKNAVLYRSSSGKQVQPGRGWGDGCVRVQAFKQFL